MKTKEKLLNQPTRAELVGMIRLAISRLKGLEAIACFSKENSSEYTSTKDVLPTLLYPLIGKQLEDSEFLKQVEKLEKKL